MLPPRVAVFMYHKVGAVVDGAPDRFINVSTAKFEAHLAFLQRRRYQAVTFAHAIKGITGAHKLPKRCFAVTFDDGYECVGENAAPALHKFGMPATVFVVSDAAGKQNEWDRAKGLPVLPLMSWNRLAELHRAGWEVAGHTHTHPHLSRLSREAALDEMRTGRDAIAANLGIGVETFCYPHGDYNLETPAIAQEAGFLGACTTESGIAGSRCNPHLLPRVKISHSDGVAGLMYKLYVRPFLPNVRRRGFRG